MRSDRQDQAALHLDADAGHTLEIARAANREIAHLLLGIAAKAEELQRQLSPDTVGEVAESVSAIEAEAWRGFAAADRAGDRFRRLLSPDSGSTTRRAAL